jgi:hypothetical protein
LAEGWLADRQERKRSGRLANELRGRRTDGCEYCRAGAEFDFPGLDSTRGLLKDKALARLQSGFVRSGWLTALLGLLLLRPLLL